MPTPDLIQSATIQHKIIFISGATIVAFLCFLRAVSLAWHDEEKAPVAERRRKMIPLIGMAIFGAGFIGCAAWFFWPASSQSIATSKEASLISSWTVENLSTLSNSELRARTNVIAQQLRQYANSIARQSSEIRQKYPNGSGPNPDPDQKRRYDAEWAEWNSRAQAGLDRDLRPAALAIYEALNIKLYRFKPIDEKLEDRLSVLFFKQQTTNPTVIVMAATQLEKMARELPSD